MASVEYAASAFSADVRDELARRQADYDRLRDMELFVLDNSLRETTVGAIRAHTMDNKRAIYEEIKKCRFKYFILESFNHQTRLGDQFIDELNAQGEDLTNAFCFSDLWEKIQDRVPNSDLPIGLQKCKEKGIRNVLFEFDLNNVAIDYSVFTMDKLCAYFRDRVQWVRDNLTAGGKVMINIRDFTATMEKHPERVFQFVHYAATMEPAQRIFGLTYEDVGGALPQQMAAWTSAVRKEMVRNGWEDGQLLFHQHEMWNLAHSSNLAALAAGATGMWAGVCSEGAAVGHADTCTAILNLIRLGNTRVVEQYNCTYLRDAAIKVTKVVTTARPSPRMPIYGSRALDFAFPTIPPPEFSLAKFLGEDETIRISSLANVEMIVSRLKADFGEDPQFTEEMGARMKEQILKDAGDNLKEEYNSKAGLSMLFDRAGGKMTPTMAAAVDASTTSRPHIDMLISRIKDDWNQFDAKDGSNDDRVSFTHFYDGFMAPYFGCHFCEETSSGLQCLDMDTDGFVSWPEFRHFLLWAGREHPAVTDESELLDIAMRDGVIRAMNDYMATKETDTDGVTPVTVM